MTYNHQEPICDSALHQSIFGELDEENATIIRSGCCSQAILNENTGIYGCCLLVSECPFGNPDPQRCLASGRFPGHYKRIIYVPNKQKRSARPIQKRR